MKHIKKHLIGLAKGNNMKYLALLVLLLGCSTTDPLIEYKSTFSDSYYKGFACGKEFSISVWRVSINAKIDGKSMQFSGTGNYSKRQALRWVENCGK